MSPRRARRLPAGMPRRPRGGLPPGRPGATGDGAGHDGESPPLRLGPERVESGPDGDWVVRAVPGGSAAKTYRCPGCDQGIAPGTAHVVAWPAHATGAAGRRHWHRVCWERRLQRHPPGRWGR